MNEFNPSHYIKQAEDQRFQSMFPIVYEHHTLKGKQLIIQYLNNKYMANISQLLYEDDHLPIPLVEFQKEPKHYLFNVFDVRNKSENYRHAFIIEARGKHVVLMVYIREGANERIFYSDSAPMSFSNEEIARELNDTTEIKVLFHEGTRQASPVGCFTDALVYGRDTTGVNQSGQFLIPNLISLLEQREETITSGYSRIKLPNELLKTSQISLFFNSHKNEDKLEKFSGDLNLDEFRDKYSKEVLMKNETTKRISTYLNEKSSKYSKIIQIQFYINEMEENLGRVLSSSEKSDFVNQAKNELETAPTLHQFSEKFLTSLISEFPEIEITSTISGVSPMQLLRPGE
ncbi:hypothetical protein [uncultured Legionella sp.]|uniref:hypothetical protein n=1 Tax=uncultured Legionella sp. TaxID=210934 RepID=UPI00260D647E|nr:hypothetical protein [uncultured Legionella sp.]